MTATDVTIPARADASSSPPPRRRLHTRLSTGHVVMILAGLLAALANVALLRSMDETVPVLVARADIPIGAPVTTDLLRTIDARLDAAVLDTLVASDQVAAGFLDGKVTTAAIPAGSPLRLADLRPTATAQPDQRRIAIPIAPELAVGGAIAIDDRIDVIQVIDGVPRFIVAGARVLARAEETSSGLGAVSSFHVTIGVDPDTALCLAAAIEAGGLSIVLSTGQEPVPTTPCVYPAPDGAADAPTGAAPSATGPATGAATDPAATSADR